MQQIRFLNKINWSVVNFSNYDLSVFFYIQFKLIIFKIAWNDLFNFNANDDSELYSIISVLLIKETF